LNLAIAQHSLSDQIPGTEGAQMKRKLWVLLLGFALCVLPLRHVAAQARTDQPSKLDAQIAKIKAAVSKRVTDDRDRVQLQLRDGSEIRGRLSQAGDNGFTLTNEKSGQQTSLAYADVQKVNGRGLSKGAKIGIIAGIVAGVAAIIVIKASRNFDPFQNGIPIRGVSF
jgi:hypothetical protein